ncbi:MAG: restriction endonuclease [Nitrosarchaeum sp.]
MAIPDFESIMYPLLSCVDDGKEHSMVEIEGRLVKQFNLTQEEERQLKPSSTTETLFQNRMRWARFYLKKAGLLIDPRRGYTKITSEGLNVLKQDIRKIDIEFLSKYPQFIEFYSKKKTDQSVNVVTAETTSKTPEDMVIEGYETYRGSIEKEILEKIGKNSPSFFESLVLELIQKMGYGVNREVLGRTGDGGIDGVIREDRLGLDEIYFQAKRWKGTVPIHQIRDFAGALMSRKSKKGIFITTSDFSGDAGDFVRSIDSKIVLINGEQLSRYMYDYNVGVTSSENVYDLKKIDEDYFED